MESLPKKTVRPNEVFTMGDEPVPVELQFDVTDFWRWSLSDLCLNVVRGNFGEFLVATVLGLTAQPRGEWENFDLKYKGIKIEVKTKGYVQTWHKPGDKNSKIYWSGVGKTQDSNQKVEGKCRWAEVYVFCLQTQKEIANYNALELNDWRFWVISTRDLEDGNGFEEGIGDQSHVSTAKLESLGATKTCLRGLRTAIMDASARA